MGQVTVSIGGKNYRMACEDGQEDRIRELAAHFGARVDMLRPSFQRIQDDHLYLMAALLIADELLEARDELQAILRQISRFGKKEVQNDEERDKPARDMARAISTAASRLQKLSDNLARKPEEAADADED